MGGKFVRACNFFLIALLASSTSVAVAAAASATVLEAKNSRPSVAPAGNWVLPAALPAPPADADGAATVNLLTDIQTRFTSEGDSTYYGIAYKIASAQGLDDAPLQVSWDPSLETLVIHRYRIIRDGKELDLLGDGSKLSVIQREKNMEDAALDGQLTATMQPDDVRVGDIIAFAFTRTRRDPAMAGKSEDLFGPEDGSSYGRLRVRFLWPDDKKIRWQAYPGVLEPKLTHGRDGSELVADLSNVRTPLAPKGAPGRFTLINAIEASEFGDWGAVSATMLPLYTQASTLGKTSPLQEQAREIASKTSDPIRRTELALQLVQEQIRYLFIGMNDGGYVPAAADLTWSRKFGDCKGKAVLLVALLRELGIDAEPVLVNTDNGDLLSKRLPAMSAFNHVIVRANIGGRAYWLDGTRMGDTRLARLRTPPYEFGLPLAAGTKALVAMTPEQLSEPSETISLALDASAGIDAPAPVKGEMRFRGPDATDMRMKYAGLSAADREQELRKMWRKNYDFISPTTITTSADETTGDFVITMTGTAKMEWYEDVGSRWYEVDRSRLGWKFDTDREGAISKDAPFAFDYPDYWASRETIKLPAGGAGFKLQGSSVDQTIGGIYAFHREVGIENGVMTMESSTRALAPELPASKAEQTRSEMSALAANGVYVRVPDTYMATNDDIAALQGNKAALAQALMHRGAVHFDRLEFALSMTDERAAIAVDPDMAAAHAILALDLAAQQDSKADAEADRAIALDPKQVLAWRAKGASAFTQKRYADADAAFSRYLDMKPGDAGILAVRGLARSAEGKFVEALADADKSLGLRASLEARLARGTALGGLEQKEESLAELDRVVHDYPDNDAVRRARAVLRTGFGETTLAIEDYGSLIKRSPTVEDYLARARLWTAADSAKKNADIAAALALDPHSLKALAFRAAAAVESGDFRAAEADIGNLEKTDEDGFYAYEIKLQLLEKQDRRSEALQLVDAFIAKHPDDSNALNERCWTKATFNLQLATALADCNASLKLRPNNAATLDSRGFTNLRLGATDAAISDYDAALKLAPGLAGSLFGRAIARAKKGDLESARADLAQARKSSPNIDARFAAFGVSIPRELAAAGTTTVQAQ